MKSRFQRFAFGAVIMAQLFGVLPSSADPAVTIPRAPHPDTLVQIATFDHLNRGGYDGVTTTEQLSKIANFGIGTIQGLDGELILLDGIAYQAPARGLLRAVTPDELIPFATVTRFHPESTYALAGPVANYVDLQAQISAWMPNPRSILAIKATGRFDHLRLRAPERQVKPYPPLAEALKTQAVFELDNLEGTLVGFRFPAHFSGVASPGYHFHFVSADRKHGGHVLEVSPRALKVEVEMVEQFNLTLE